MSSSNDYKMQVSLKTPAGTLINLPTGSAEEATAALVALQTIAPEIVATEQILAGCHAAAPVIVGAAQTQTSGSGGTPPATPFAPPAAASPQPSCPHGPRKWITSGANAAEPWAGWFCPEPKTSPNRCKAEYDRNYGK